MAERLSQFDQTLIASYADHIQRYQFAKTYCEGKDVLDAGCGIGYGAHYVAEIARSVTGVDIAETALSEAVSMFARQNIEFRNFNIEELSDAADLKNRFDVVINFENLEHLDNPEAFLVGVSTVLRRPSGRLIVSTPNGEIAELDLRGKPRNPFHVKEYTMAEMRQMLTSQFPNIRFFGQWLTFDGRLRQLRARQTFDQLQSIYFNPVNRFGRLLQRLTGKRPAAAPEFTAAGDSYSGDYVIEPIEATLFPWPPTVLIAVCSY